MNKTNKGKVVQMLTPENYIRKKARTLPIFECLLSDNWEESGLPTVVIARNHTNGNITVCSYMVDLKCLGVKDTSYQFNISISQYEDFKEMISEVIELMPVDYALAHNIVLAGVEYAEELGFKPYKDYESVTKFMLEEDTDEIELIEVECGQKGKPFYVQGPHDDMAKVNRIIAQLEKAVGHGNFNVLLQGDEQFKDPFQEDEMEEEDEFKDWTLEEKKNLFLSLTNSPEKMNLEETARLFILTESLVSDLVDIDLYEQYYDQYFEDLDLEVTDDAIPDEFMGVNFGEQIIEEEWKTRFYDLLSLCDDNPKKARKELKLFDKETKGIPAVYLVELILLQNEKSPQYVKQLKEYASLFPEYAMIQLIYTTWQVTELKQPQKIPGYPFAAKDFFGDRQFIHAYEYMNLLTLNSITVGYEMDINKIVALIDVISDLDIPDEQQELLIEANTMLKFAYVSYYMNQSKP